jgi:hypothetical protein
MFAEIVVAICWCRHDVSHTTRTVKLFGSWLIDRLFVYLFVFPSVPVLLFAVSLFETRFDSGHARFIRIPIITFFKTCLSNGQFTVFEYFYHMFWWLWGDGEMNNRFPPSFKRTGLAF